MSLILLTDFLNMNCANDETSAAISVKSMTSYILIEPLVLPWIT